MGRVLAVAMPVAAALGLLAHVQGIGWYLFDCVHVPGGGTRCGGFVGNPFLWPWGWPAVSLGGAQPSAWGFVAVVFWWIFLGFLAGALVDRLLARKEFRLNESRAGPG